jgi:hypothetical protein
MLTDRVTKRKREVDVCIEGHAGAHPVVVSIECRDHKRIADVSWVEEMKTKHGRLPTSVLILASRSGFTSGARDTAASYGIQTFSLSDVDEADFPALIGTKGSLWTKSVTLAAEKVRVKVLPTSTLAEEVVTVTPDNLVYSPDGNELYEIVTLVKELLNSPAARDFLLSKGKEDHVWFEMVWQPPRDNLGNPFFLKKTDPATLREIESIQLMGPCNFQITQFGMRRGKLGDISLTWGKADLLGRDAIVVATEDSAGVKKLSINFAGKPK